MVLFGLTILIPNTKYRILYKILEKNESKIKIFVHTRHFVMQSSFQIR